MSQVDVDPPLAMDGERRFAAAWLYRPRTDLAILFIPCLVTLAAALVAAGPGKGERAYAAWISQFILGNSTHVILTFLLLGVRRDVLHATERQAFTVLLGSTLTFAATFLLFWGTNRYASAWSDFAFAITLLFATHHTLSQAKGIWSLYNLRAHKDGFSAPSESERSLQRHFVPIGLLLIAVKWLFVPKAEGAEFPFVQAIPGEPAFLPIEVTYFLLAAWLCFYALLLRALLATKTVNVAKVVYVSVHAAVVALSLVSPPWGGIVSAGIHGLEYFFLCARMLAPTKGEEGSRLGVGLVWPAMMLAMAPLFVVGLLNAPFTRYLVAPSSAFGTARFVLNAVVMAHYFADAFIYRFRIPSVRRVALARLGFA